MGKSRVTYSKVKSKRRRALRARNAPKREVIVMSEQMKIKESPNCTASGFPMDTFHVANCCRACLSIESSLIEISSLDHDLIKYCDKLTACVPEVMWLKEGLPLLICSNCIESLRVAYAFRNVCLQSDQTFARYISQMQDEHKSERPEVESTSPLDGEVKFEFTSTQVIPDTLPCIKQEPLDSPPIHFPDNDDCLVKSEHFIETAEFRNCTFEPEKCVNFIGGQERLEPIIDAIDGKRNMENLESKEVNQIIQLHQQQQLIHPQNDPHLQPELQAQQQQLQQKEVVEQATGVQMQPPLPKHITFDGVQSKTYTCMVCSKIYCRKDSLRIHLRTHTGEKPFQCEHCEKRFYQSIHLTEHIRRHTGEKPFKCTVCDKRFTTKRELLTHMKSHTGDKPFGCNACDRRFLTPTDLKLHIRTHTGEKPYSCDTCGKKFVSVSNLNSHIKTHTGVKPFTCKICEKTFSQSLHLDDHMRKHTGEKISCKICDAKFARSSNLSIHMREHTGKQPYRCTVCEKVYIYPSSLKVHMRIHTGEKPHTCTTCDKKFRTSSELAIHTKTHKKVETLYT